MERLGETTTGTVRGVPRFLRGVPRLLGGMPSEIHVGFGGNLKVLEAFSEGLEVILGVFVMCT